MTAVMLQVIPSIFVEYSEKCLISSADTYKNYIVLNDICVAFHDDKSCSVCNCKFHNSLLGNASLLEELLKNSEKFCFIYQHVDCLYTLFKYRFCGNVIAKSGQVFDNVQRAVNFNHRNKGVDRRPSIAKKRLLRKKEQKAFIPFLPKEKKTQSSSSVFAEGVEKVKKTKSESEIIKIADCFLGVHSIYDSNLVSFKIKSL